MSLFQDFYKNFARDYQRVESIRRAALMPRPFVQPLNVGLDLYGPNHAARLSGRWDLGGRSLPIPSRISIFSMMGDPVCRGASGGVRESVCSGNGTVMCPFVIRVGEGREKGGAAVGHPPDRPRFHQYGLMASWSISRGSLAFLPIANWRSKLQLSAFLAASARGLGGFPVLLAGIDEVRDCLFSRVFLSVYVDGIWTWLFHFLRFRLSNEC